MAVWAGPARVSLCLIGIAFRSEGQSPHRSPKGDTQPGWLSIDSGLLAIIQTTNNPESIFTAISISMVLIAPTQK